MQNLQITIHLETPVLLGHPYIHFDGLVLHLSLREKMGNNYYTELPSKQPREVIDHQRQNIIKVFNQYSDQYGGHRGLRLYHASTSIFDTDLMAATTLYKKFDTNHTDRLDSRKTISSDRGLFKSYMMRMLYNPSRKCRFYCHGDYDHIKYLLDFLPGLGKKVDVGFGAISKIDVEKIDKDKSIINDGKAMRPIPVELLESYSDAYPSVFIPPYWNRVNTRLCAPPLSEVRAGKELARILA